MKTRDNQNAESAWSSPIQVIISLNRAPNKPTEPIGTRIGKLAKAILIVRWLQILMGINCIICGIGEMEQKACGRGRISGVRHVK